MEADTQHSSQAYPIEQNYFIQQHQGTSNFLLCYSQWFFSHIEFLPACFYLLRNDILFTTIIHYSYPATFLSTSSSAASLQWIIATFTSSNHPWPSNYLPNPEQTSIIASNQLQVISILQYFHTTFETRSNLSKANDMILPRSDGTHSRGHTRAEWEYCV